MTREEAKKEIIDMANALQLIPNTPKGKAVSMALKTLEQEPCKDTISRREAIKKFTYNYKGERIPDYDCDNFPVQIDIKTVKKMLRDLPPVTPQPKTGQWVNKSQRSGCGVLFVASECTCCGMKTLFNCDEFLYRYCPNCGARMVEPQESEE